MGVSSPTALFGILLLARWIPSAFAEDQETTTETTPEAIFLSCPEGTVDSWINITSVDTFSEKLHGLLSPGVNENTFFSLLAAYERLVDDPPLFRINKTTFVLPLAGSATVFSDPHDAYVSSDALKISRRILQDTAHIIGNISVAPYHVKACSKNFIMQIVKMGDLDKEHNFRNNFDGKMIHESSTFTVSAMCLVSDVVNAGFVIFPVNRNPLRPLPVLGPYNQTISAFRVVIVVLIALEDRVVGLDPTSCSINEFLDVVMLHWASTTYVPNLKYGCAQWRDSTARWSSDDCFAVQNLGDARRATCYCDTKGGGQTIEHIMYEYSEDVAYGLRFDKNLNFTVEDPKDVVELKLYESRISDLADSPSLTSSYDALIAGLPFVLEFDADVILNTSINRILDHIGSVLTHVVMENDAVTIGRGNTVISSIVFSIEGYRWEPLVGYAFRKDSDVWMDYFRLRDDLDTNMLFHEHNAFSLMFSETTVQQNVRYGFVLFPQDKYLKPITVIDGHDVIASQVVDITLVQLADLNDRVAQFVHIYFNPDKTDDTVLTHACAYWSNRNDTWLTKDCRADLGLYRQVCTCNMTANFNETRSRGQYVGYVYRESAFNVKDGGALSDYQDFNFISTSLFGLQELRKYHYGAPTVNKELNLMGEVMFNPNGTLRLSEGVKKKLISEARALLATNDCLPLQLHEVADSFGVFCHNANDRTAKAPVVGVSYRRSTGSLSNPIKASEYTDAKMFNNDTLFAVRVSNSVTKMNDRYAVLVYPTNMCLKLQPAMDMPIIEMRSIDVVLVAGEKRDVDVEQTFTIYLDQTLYNATQSCAYWHEEWQAWTEIGCFLVKLNALDVCNCSLSKHFDQDRAGGQFIVVTYSSAYFNETVYKELCTRRKGDTVETVFREGAALIRNASRVPITDEQVVKVLQVFVTVVSLDRKFLDENGVGVKEILHDLQVMFSRYKADPWRPVIHSYGITSTWDVQNAEVVLDLFSNAVISTNTTAKSVTSYMLLAVFGYLDSFGPSQPTGLYTSRGADEKVNYSYENQTIATLNERPTFAILLPSKDTLAYYRLVFTVYPLNISPYPKTMSAAPVFNTRQVDVYIDLHNVYTPFYTKLTSVEALIDVYFRPTANPKNYVQIACASWSDVLDGWTTDLCTLKQTNDDVFCRCVLDSQPVTRIVVYEYTSLPNFSLMTHFESKSIVYLVGAALSFFGLIMITLTALIFPQWRNDVGNKILMHLTVSSFMYLFLSVYRETHFIFSAMNYTNTFLIVFTVVVHYTRLSYYCWGLAMSLLQSMRFSGDISVIDSPYLVTKMALLAWGVPLVPLIALLSWNMNEHFCNPAKLTHYVLYLVPGAVITVLNIGFLVAILYKITNKFGCGLNEDFLAYEDWTSRLRTAILMFFLFGIPTVFEMFNGIWGHSMVVEYIDKVLDPIQGFVLFLFFIVIDKRSKGYWNVWVFGPDRNSSESEMEMTNFQSTKMRISKRIAANGVDVS